MRIQKKQLVWILLFCLMVLTGSLISYLSGSDYRAVSGLGTSRPIVIIDPGHGGVDGGAVGVDGTLEKNINLSISEKLRSILELGGFKVIMTRESDISIHDSSAKTTRQQKTSDLHNRLAIIEANPGAIFVSIHQNKFSVGKYWGAQVFYSPNNPESMALAQLIQESVTGELQPDNSREIKKAGDNLFLLYNAKSPAVLVECGFLSNAAENARLNDPTYQDELAFCIYMAIVEYYG